jgi:hypothetical protein
VRAGNVIVAASRRRAAVVVLFPGAGVFPSETQPLVTGNRAGRVYYAELEIPATLTARRGRVYYAEIEVPT